MNSRMSKSGIDKFYIFHFKYRVTINNLLQASFWINRVPMKQTIVCISPATSNATFRKVSNLKHIYSSLHDSFYASVNAYRFLETNS